MKNNSVSFFLAMVLFLFGNMSAEEVHLEMGPAEDGVRLKELCFVEGVRQHQLNGVGVVVGLNGTGDDKDAVLKAMGTYLKKHNIQIDRSYRDVKGKNIALVVVTARLPAFMKPGAKIDVTVSTIGDAKSLVGGVLLQTPLAGFDGRYYAAAQGPISIAGYGDAGPGLVPTGRDHKKVETTGIVPDGGIVETEFPLTYFFEEQISDTYGQNLTTRWTLKLALHNPDFTNVSRVAHALRGRFPEQEVRAIDATSVGLSFVKKPTESKLIEHIAMIEELRVNPDALARVVINERSGTVVVGSDVRISPVSVSHGGLSLRVYPKIVERADPDNPGQRERVETWEDPYTTNVADTAPQGILTSGEDIPGSLTVIEGTTVEAISNALNSLGARPADMIAIFQAIARSGALHAELVVM